MINRYCDILHTYAVSRYIMYIGRYLRVIDHIINIVSDLEIIVPLSLLLDDRIIWPNRVQQYKLYTYTHTYIHTRSLMWWILFFYISSNASSLIVFVRLSSVPSPSIVRHGELLYSTSWNSAKIKTRYRLTRLNEFVRIIIV